MGPAIRIGLEISPINSGAGALDTTIRQASQAIEGGLNVKLSRTVSLVDQIGKSAGSMLTSFKNATVTAASLLYTVERIGSIAKTSLVDPVTGFVKATIEATEVSRKFEASLATSSGGLSGSRLLNLQLIRDSQNSAASIEELRDAARSLASNPSFAASIGLGTSQDAARSVEQFASLSKRLQLLAPSDVNAESALRQALGGNYRGLRSLGISTESLASIEGVQSKDLRGNAPLTLDAINKWADTFLAPDDYARISGLVSVRYQQLQSGISYALKSIGDAGFYGSISNRLKSVTSQLFTYFDSVDFQKQAARISTSLDKVTDNVERSVEGLLNSVSGKPADLSTVAGTTQTVGNLLDRIAHLSDGLPNAVRSIGPSISAFSDRMGKFMDAVVNISDFINDPLGGGRVGVEIGQRTQTAVLEKKVAAYDAARARDPFSGTSYGETMNRLQLNYLQQQTALSGVGATTRPSTGPLIGPSTQPSALLPRADESYATTLVRNLTGLEFTRPSYASLLAASNASVGDLRTAAEKEQTPLEKVGKYNVFGDISFLGAGGPESVSFRHFLSLVSQKNDYARDILDQAIAKPSNPNDIAYLRSLRGQIGDDYDHAYSSIRQSKITDVTDLSSETWKALNELPAEARLQIQQSIIAGSSPAANDFATIFGEPAGGRFDTLGLGALPFDVQRQRVQQNISDNAAAIEAIGERSQTPRDASASLLNYFNTSAIPESQDLVTRLGKTDQSNPLNTALLKSAQADLGNLQHKVAELNHSLDDAGLAWEKFASSGKDSFENSLGASIDAVITKTGSLRDIWNGFESDLIRGASQLAAHDILGNLLGYQFLQPGQGQGGIGSGGLGGIIGSLVSGFHFGGSSINAQGGVGSVPYGPPTPFANGGYVHQPTLSMLGEGRYSEAVIPLPDGRHVEAVVKGASGRQVTQHITINTPNADSFRRSSAQIQRQLRQAAADD